MRRIFIILAMIALHTTIYAQEDGLNLPTELYVLLNEGRVERYGLGAAGVATVTPEDIFILDFGVAPDGTWMAYRSEDGLFGLNMITNTIQQIEGDRAGVPPFRGRGSTIAWSPDADVLAYTVEYGMRFYFGEDRFFDVATTPILNLRWSWDGRYLAAEAENNVWWVYRREGDEMILNAAIVSSLGLEWVDMTVLMFAPETGGLFLMDVANANAQAQIHDETVFFQEPVRRPDGSVRIFGRSPQDTDLLEGAGFLYTVTFGPQGEINRASDQSINLEGLRWVPSGNLLIGLQSGVLLLADPNSATAFPLPVNGVVAYSWGALRPNGVDELALTSDLFLLADDGRGILQLWRHPQSGATPTLITQIPAGIETFTVAPDGQTIAYVSDGQLWLLPPTSVAGTALAEVADVGTLAFNPEGTAITFDTPEGIFTVGLEEGSTVESLLSGYTEPAYTAEAGRLFVRLADGDSAFFDQASGDVRRLGAFNTARLLADGRIAAGGAPVAGNQLGLYLIDPANNFTPELVFPSPNGLRIQAMLERDPGEVRLVLGGDATGPTPLQVVDVPLDGGDPLSLPSPGFMAQPRLSSDGRFLAGYISAARVLSLYDLSTTQQRSLSQPSGVNSFHWE